MSTYRILFLGDIVGKPGREAVLGHLPRLQNELKPLFTIVNGENSASGIGITPDISEKLLHSGVDAITLGNHAFNKRDIAEYLDRNRPIVRPANMPQKVPGKGLITIEKNDIQLAIANICGRVFLEGYDDPFACADTLLQDITTKHIFIDFHAEATSEKVAFGHYLDGRASAVVGTHTHVPTADAKVLPGGTAYITDVGMCGPIPSVIGMDKDIVLRKFLTSMPTRFEVANQPGVISGVTIDVNKETGRATNIKRVDVSS